MVRLADAWASLRGKTRAIEFTGDLRRMTLCPGDVLVLRSPELHVSDQQLKDMGALLESKFPGHVCLVLTGGMSLDVVSHEKAQGYGFLQPDRRREADGLNVSENRTAESMRAFGGAAARHPPPDRR